MGADIEKNEAVGLTEKERDSATRLLQAVAKLDPWCKEIAAAYVEGMAAGNATRPPQATA